MWGAAVVWMLGVACTAQTPVSIGPERPVVKGVQVARSEHVRLLGFNDFHGNLVTTRKVDGRPVGGAAVLAAYLTAAANEVGGNALIIHAGDHVGASPPVSGLLQDEPSIQFLNALGNSSCSVEARDNPACNLVGTLGNHEFDEGRAELLRLVYGGDSPRGPFLEVPYKGAAFSYVCANVVDTTTGAPLLAPFVIRRVGNVRVGVVGAVVRHTPTIVMPTGVAGLTFRDEAEAINDAVDALLREGIRAIVVTIHQGGEQSPYTGATAEGVAPEGDILPIMNRLHDEVDVVISGHAHQFTNAFVRNQTGKSMLVTQAFSAGTAFAQIDVQVDAVTGDIVHKTAQVVTTFADVLPGSQPDPRILKLVQRAEEVVVPRINRVVGRANVAVTRAPNESGESAIGNLVADAQRAKAKTDFALTNRGGLRADLDAGEVTWGELYTIQPFGNSLVRMDITGAQLVELLERQWAVPDAVRTLHTSGFSYRWDAERPVGTKVLDVSTNGAPIDRNKLYSVAMNAFMADGGDGFRGGSMGRDKVTLGSDLEALVEYVEAQPNGVTPIIDGRVVKVR